MRATTASARTMAMASAPTRLQSVDDIRWLLIVLVLGTHAACTYSGFGRWYWTEPHPLDLGSTLFFAFFQSFLQAFFMALLFFLAGCFTPGACERRGPAGFLVSRILRLGLPTLLFALLIGPLTEYYVAGSWHTKRPFGDAMVYYVTHGNVLAGTGPLWFCAALLLFSVVYALLRPLLPTVADIKPGLMSLLATIAALTVATFLARTVWPVGAAFYNMQLCYFASYVIMFTLGIVASRSGWLHRVQSRAALIAAASCLVPAMLLWLPLLVIGGALEGQIAPFNGGWTWQSGAMTLWEALVCVGMSLALIAGFRAFAPGPGRFGRFMTANAFAVYVIHPPLLVAVALVLNLAALPAIAKFVALWALTALLCFGVAAPLARRLPLLGPILR